MTASIARAVVMRKNIVVTIVVDNVVMCGGGGNYLPAGAFHSREWQMQAGRLMADRRRRRRAAGRKLLAS